MFKFYLTLVFSTILLYLIYNKYFNNNYRIGEWLEINRDINIKYQLEWDISNNSSVKIANFSTWKKYFFGNDFYNTIKNNEAIVMDFFPTQDSNCILDVCDQEMKPIYHIIDPDFLIFSNQNNKNHYNLEPKKKYIFFLRDNHLGNQSKTILRKYKDITKITKKPNNKNILTCCIDEEELHKEFVTKCESIMDAMKKRDYTLTNIVRSEEYLSFPSNLISNKLKVDSELGDVLVLVCTNKSKTSGMLNHTIEINSKNNNLNWFPEDNETISHLLLNNCDQDDIFSFFERTTNVSNGSKILPFHVMVFKND